MVGGPSAGAGKVQRRGSGSGGRAGRLQAGPRPCCPPAAPCGCSEGQWSHSPARGRQAGCSAARQRQHPVLPPPARPSPNPTTQPPPSRPPTCSSSMPILRSPFTIFRLRSSLMYSERSEKKECGTGRGSTCQAAAGGGRGAGRVAGGGEDTGRGRGATPLRQARPRAPAGRTRRQLSAPTAMRSVGTPKPLMTRIEPPILADMAAAGVVQMDRVGSAVVGCTNNSSSGVRPACSLPAAASLTAVALHVDKHSWRVCFLQLPRRLENLLCHAKHLCRAAAAQRAWRSGARRRNAGAAWRDATQPHAVARARPPQPPPTPVVHPPEITPLMRVTRGSLRQKEAPALMPSAKTGRWSSLCSASQLSRMYLTPQRSS